MEAGQWCVRLACDSVPPAAGSPLPRSCPSWGSCVDANGNPTLERCLGPHDLPVNGSWLQASDEWKGRVTAYWRELYLNFSRQVAAMAPVMTTMSNFTSEPCQGTRAALAKLIVASSGVGG